MFCSLQVGQVRQHFRLEYSLHGQTEVVEEHVCSRGCRSSVKPSCSNTVLTADQAVRVQPEHIAPDLFGAEEGCRSDVTIHVFCCPLDVLHKESFERHEFKS